MIDTRPNVFAALRYRDAHAAIAWLNRAFAFEAAAVYDGPAGTVAHGELRHGASVIGVNSAGPVDPANPWTTVRQGLYVWVGDVDAHHANAVSHGASIVRPLADTSYGAREYSVRDLAGHLWSFGTYDMAAPRGAQTIFPCLHYEDGQATLDWLSRTFGFAVTMRVPATGARVDHAELRLGVGVVMVSSSPRASGLWGEDSQCACVVVADPDAHFAQAVGAGAQVVQPCLDTSYGARAYYARDVEGFLWGFSTYDPASANG